jgi:DNA topoisomerase-2
MILINGACGIGTGFSTDIPCFNPEDIKSVLMKLVDDEDAEINELTPWYSGFTGTIKKIEDSRWITTGVYKIENLNVIVTELPIGTWTDDYKAFLDKLESENIIYSYKNNSTETTILFTIKIPNDTLWEWKKDNIIEKKLKLTSNLSAKNMHVFNEKSQIVKMECAEEIVYHFWMIRNDYYLRRQKNLLNKYENELNIINSRINFINDIMDDKVAVFRKKLEFINKQLEDKNYHKVDSTYKYLTDMQIHSFTDETVEKFIRKQKVIEEKYTTIKNYTLKDFWKKDL